MPAQAWQLDALRIAGLCLAAVLLLAGIWVLRAARRDPETAHMTLPGLGLVWAPTGLTIAICILAAGYHVLAYSLFPSVTLLAVPRDRWWIVAAVIAIAILGALGAERLGSDVGEHGPDEGP